MKNKMHNNIKVKTNSLMVLLVSVFLLSALAGVQFVGKVSAATAYTEYNGALGGANYTIRIPSPIESWNRDLEVFCRGYVHDMPATAMGEGFFSNENLAQAAISRGTAFAVSTYGSGGYCVQAGMDTTYQLTQYVRSTFNATGKVYLYGASMGGDIALMLGEKYPNVYSGVLDVCGAKNLTYLYNAGNLVSTSNDTEVIAQIQANNAPVPPYPFSLYGSSWMTFYRAWCSQVVADMVAEFGGTPSAVPQAYRNADPLYHADIAIPVITVHGTSDALVPYSTTLDYKAAVTAAGKASLYRLYAIAGGEHVGSSVMADAANRFDELVAWSDILTESKTYGGANTDAGYPDIVQSSDGGYAIVGETSLLGAGGLDAYLVKTDADGNMQWNKTYGGPLNETGFRVCSTSDGGYAIIGTTSSFGAGGSDGWLVKTGANGIAYWAKTYGGTGDDTAVSVAQTADGGYAIVGYTNSSGAGKLDYWLIKTDAAGNMEWSKTYGRTNDDWGCDLILTSDGGYALLGYSTSFGGWKAWLIKTDSAGNEAWNKTYGIGVVTWVASGIQTADGGYAMSGATYGPFLTNIDTYLVKTDSSGNMLWNKTYGGTGTEQGGGLVQMADGGYAVVSETNSSGAGGMDGWLFRTDSSGNMLWNKTFGGPGKDNTNNIVLTADGGFAIAGYTNSFGTGNSELWLIKTDELGVIPEGLTIGVMMLLATVAVIVGTRYFRKRPKNENFSKVKL
jgi:pimeloyl-ACP methyl ester carboxylesterase